MNRALCRVWCPGHFGFKEVLPRPATVFHCSVQVEMCRPTLLKQHHPGTVVEIPKDLVGSVMANPRSTTPRRGSESESPSWEKEPEGMEVESLTMEQHKWSPYRRGIGQWEVTGNDPRVDNHSVSPVIECRMMCASWGCWSRGLLTHLGPLWLPFCSLKSLPYHRARVASPHVD